MRYDKNNEHDLGVIGLKLIVGPFGYARYSIRVLIPLMEAYLKR
jgi:hypothetical protein